jgi:hypothetical protein
VDKSDLLRTFVLDVHAFVRLLHTGSNFAIADEPNLQHIFGHDCGIEKLRSGVF